MASIFKFEFPNLLTLSYESEGKFVFKFQLQFQNLVKDLKFDLPGAICKVKPWKAVRAGCYGSFRETVGTRSANNK